MGGKKIIKVKAKAKPKPVLGDVANPPFIKEFAKIVRGWDKSKKEKKPSTWGKAPGSLPKGVVIKVKKR